MTKTWHEPRNAASLNRCLQRSYESEDGKREVITGFNKQFDAENAGMSMRGSYSWVHEGVSYTVNWVADENGFQPEGAHLPVAPVV